MPSDPCRDRRNIEARRPTTSSEPCRAFVPSLASVSEKAHRSSALLRLRQVSKLLLLLLVPPHVVELGSDEESNVDHTESRQCFVGGVVVRHIVLSVNVDSNNATNLVAHVVDCR